MAEAAELTLYVKAYLALLAMVDPPFVIPMYLQIIAGRTAAEKRVIAIVGILGFVALMVLFVFVGTAVLGLFGISIAAFQLAGGFLLMIMALELLRAPLEPPEDGPGVATSAVAAGIVPLAIPVLAGPGALSTAVLFAADFDGVAHLLALTGVVLAIAATVIVMFLAASRLERVFTPEVALVFNRIMGLVVAAIAFEFLLHGLAGHFENLDVSPLH